MSADASQTLKQEIARIVSGNDLYNSYRDRWIYLLRSYIGGSDYRRAGYLVRYVNETDDEYLARTNATPLENHCSSVVSVYNSFLFREMPARDLGTLATVPAVEDFLWDVDFEGRSLDNFMKEIATWSSVYGHTWIMVVKPNVNAQTLGEEQEMGVRPYLSMLTAPAVLDWQWTRNDNGSYSLSYFKYLEDVNGDVHTVKEWTPESIITDVVDVAKQAIIEQTEEPNQLGIIPAVIHYNSRGPTRGVGVSDITDIADLQKFIYNATSEIDQSIRLDSHPSLVKTPETQAGIGAGSIIHMPDNLDPGLKPYVLQFSGASVDNILKAVERATDAIDKMANIGAVRANQQRTISGVAMETEFQLLNARLSEKADNLELAEEQMWRFWAMYMNQQWTGWIKYPGSFNIRDTENEIRQLKVARETAQDPRVLREIDRRILEWMEVDPEQVFAEQEDSRTYPNGEPIDPRLPEAYRDATGESQQCENCQFYNSQTFTCEAFGGAPVRPMWVCAQWQGDNQ